METISEIITAATIKKLIREQLVAAAHMRNHRVMFEEFTPATGTAPGNATRIDAWIIDLWPSNRFERIAIEIKVSRSDYLAELKQPAKRRFALLYSNSFYFVAPRGLIRAAELPPEAGLIEVNEDNILHTIVKAPFRESLPPTWAFVASICRRVNKELELAA